MYTLAWPEDPLANKFAILSEPNGVTIDLTTTPDPYADFSTLAAALGCNYGDDYDAELECMRQISFVQLEETLNNWNATPSISFADYIREFFPNRIITPWNNGLTNACSR